MSKAKSIRKALLSITDRRFKKIDDIPGVPAFCLQSMSELERANFESLAETKKNKKAVKRLLVVKTAVEDENGGEPIFSGSDIEAMGEMDSAVVDRIASEAMKLCGIGEHDLDDLLGKPENDSSPETDG